MPWIHCLFDEWSIIYSVSWKYTSKLQELEKFLKRYYFPHFKNSRKTMVYLSKSKIFNTFKNMDFPVEFTILRCRQLLKQLFQLPSGDLIFFLKYIWASFKLPPLKCFLGYTEVYLFLFVLVSYDCYNIIKLDDLKHILLEFYSPESEISFAGCKSRCQQGYTPSRDSRGESVPCLT